MQIAIPTLEWRVLRQVARTRRPSPGTTLRLEMTRRTKDGNFLSELVRQGLLEIATPGETPFDATYRLTDLGSDAAEYGVYELSWEEYKAQRKG